MGKNKRGKANAQAKAQRRQAIDEENEHRRRARQRAIAANNVTVAKGGAITLAIALLLAPILAAGQDAAS